MTTVEHKTINFWPGFIILLIGMFLIMTFWSIRLATDEGSPITDKNYYSHGLKYNKTSLELHAAESLGWEIRPQLSGQNLTIRLFRGDGALVADGIGSVSISSYEQLSTAGEYELVEISPGIYTAHFDFDILEPTMATMALSSNGATVQRRILLNPSL